MSDTFSQKLLSMMKSGPVTVRDVVDEFPHLTSKLASAHLYSLVRNGVVKVAGQIMSREFKNGGKKNIYDLVQQGD